MYTQCLNCETLFRVSAADLRAGHGKVRCGACNTVFNALYHLHDEPPAIPTVSERIALNPETPHTGTAAAAPVPPTLQAEAPPPEILSAPAPRPYAEVAPGILDPVASLFPATLAGPFAVALPCASEPAPRFSAFDTEPPEQVIQPEQVIEERPSTEEPAELVAPPAEFSLSEAEGFETGAESYPFALPPPARKPYGWLAACAWSVAIFGLIALLLAQYLYFSRHQLAHHAELRPVLSAFCAAVNGLTPCEIPLRRDINRIEVENRTVQPHPGAPNALLIHLTLANKARFAQPYPVLELSFTDLNANLIAQRRFQPGEYLERGVNIGNGMTPDIPLQVTLELAAPDNGLNFELSSWNLALY